MIEITEKDLQEVPLEDEYTAMLETQGEEATKAFYICNAFKYLHRQKRKGGVKDIKKAKWCLEKYLEISGITDKEREQMKIFISQPMKGRDAEEIQKEREEAIMALKAKYGEGVEIIDSFVKDFPKDANAAWFLGKSIELLSLADGALFLGNWYEARGCRVERTVCHDYGIEIVKL